MPAIVVHDFRMTFFWAQTLPELLKNDGAAAGELGFLADQDAYVHRFAEVLKKNSVPGRLQVPWRHSAGDFFWTYYLEGAVPGEIQPEKAWRYLVPFRYKIPIKIEAPWLTGGRLSLESFLYPFGVALALSVRIQTSTPLFKAVEKAHELRSGGKLEVQWADQTHDSLILDAFGRKGLDFLRHAVLGSEEGSVQPLPFTLVTFVNVDGVKPDKPTPEGRTVHRALQALSTWSGSWRSDMLKKLDQTRLATRTSPPSHVLQASERSRVVWFPGLYLPPPETRMNRRSVSCYHRNLFLTSMQVDSLAGLVAVTDRMLQRQEIPKLKHRELSQRAVGILGRLYGGARSTYRSWSPRAHLDQNDCVAPINRVREYFAMKPLE